jgi:hypothetical protein
MVDNRAVVKAACIQAAATVLVATIKPASSIDSEMIARFADEIYEGVVNQPAVPIQLRQVARPAVARR